MIQKIKEISRVGKFNNFHQDIPFKYAGKGQNINIIFGFNGSGKTTIANIFSLFANSSFISEDEKLALWNDLENGNGSFVELELANASSDIKYPAIRPHSKEIYVFNNNFVLSHVFNGSKSNIKRFSNVSGEIKNERILDLERTIQTLEDEKEQLEKENKSIAEKFEAIKKRNSQKFAQSLTDKNKRLGTLSIVDSVAPEGTLTSLEAQLSASLSDYELSKKQSEINTDVEKISKIKFILPELDMGSIFNLLKKDIKQLSKDVLESRIKRIQSLFAEEDKKEKVESWYKFSKDILNKSVVSTKIHCPLCNTDISERIGDIISDFDTYFDKSYELFTEELKGKINYLSLIVTSLNEIKEQSDIFDKYFGKYKNYINIKSIILPDFNLLIDKTSKMKDALIEKSQNIQKIYFEVDLSEKEWGLFKEQILELEEHRKNILTALSDKSLNTHEIEEKLRTLYKKITVLETNELDNGGTIELYKNNYSRIIYLNSSQENGIPFFKRELAVQLQLLKVESKSINKYLNKMGIDHFDVDINESNPEENIVVRYKYVDRVITKLRNCISDGEKTALAFAYFLSKFENEVNTEDKLKASVIIIDDPISSLDENRLYNTAFLMRECFDNAKEIIVLSHNFIFLKFFNSFYKSKANCLFLNGSSLKALPEELKNFETPYFYMLKHLISYLDEHDNTVTYENSRKYLPNFIRRVLETFLSFKFSEIVCKKGGGRSPGLSEFDEDIESTSLSPEVKLDLKRNISNISNLCHICSHGNAQCVQENFHIPQEVLSQLVKDALYVIETMDKLHITSLKNKFPKETPPASEAKVTILGS